MSVTTQAQITAAARALNKRHAQLCGIDEADSWKVQGEDFLADAAAALCAAMVAEPADTAALEWNPAPIRTEWGKGMMQATVALSKDHTLNLYAEREALHLVTAALAAQVQAVTLTDEQIISAVIDAGANLTSPDITVAVARAAIAEFCRINGIAAHPTKQPAPTKRECADTDAILRALGLSPKTCRTDGGSLKLQMIVGAIEHRDVMIRREARKAERERCAAVCDTIRKQYEGDSHGHAAERAAKAIRLGQP